jgi:hypothetical protein
MTTKIYTSDGSDGYTAGTYGYVITSTTETDGQESVWFDGGLPSRERAAEAAKKRAASIRDSERFG